MLTADLRLKIGGVTTIDFFLLLPCFRHNTCVVFYGVEIPYLHSIVYVNPQVLCAVPHRFWPDSRYLRQWLLPLTRRWVPTLCINGDIQTISCYLQLFIVICIVLPFGSLIRLSHSLPGLSGVSAQWHFGVCLFQLKPKRETLDKKKRMRSWLESMIMHDGVDFGHLRNHAYQSVLDCSAISLIDLVRAFCLLDDSQSLWCWIG